MSMKPSCLSSTTRDYVHFAGVQADDPPVSLAIVQSDVEELKCHGLIPKRT